MKHSTTSTFSATVLALVLLGLGGCAGMTARERSTATGAVIGGAVGVITGGGALGTAAGAAAGGFIGHELGKR
ncbi:osmotically-inducible lipoprotein B [uncultured Rhodoferax sp.]|uniref:osmotically-inducible lipoprotein B n=1 Tax=uncultured Rhodoferax sp. TaxID=223188 RepID=UPI0025FE89F9|nr:osmotically-inducible lipoprotein B [uncultured Rhodoferax sp.]